MQIDIQEVQRIKARLAEINKPLLSELEFIQEGSQVEIPQAIIEWWELSGLTNVDFVMSFLSGRRLVWGKRPAVADGLAISSQPCVNGYICGWCNCQVPMNILHLCDAVPGQTVTISGNAISLQVENDN